jgi:glycosyltransferase involved in cell wall biosynthesis
MSKDKKLLLVGNTAWSMYNFRLGVASFLKNDGYNVTIAAPPDHTTELIRDAGFKIIDIEIDNKGVSVLNDLRLLAELLKLYRRIKPDVVVHYTIKPNIYGTIAAKIAGITSIAFVTGLGSMFIKRTLITRVIERMYQFSFLFPEKVWFLNEDDYRYFVDKGLVSRAKAEILPGEGVNTVKFNSDSYQKEINPTSFKFLYLGRILKDKGIIEIIEAARKIKAERPETKIQFLGFIDALNPSAISKEDVDSWVKEGIIDYLGQTNDVIPYLSNADCVLLPSYREGISMTLLEAASMQKPIIASNVTGCKEVVNDGITGYLCQPRDSSDLYAQMKKILQLNQEQIKEMGIAARKKILNEFDEKLVINKYSATLKKIV